MDMKLLIIKSYQKRRFISEAKSMKFTFCDAVPLILLSPVVRNPRADNL